MVRGEEVETGCKTRLSDRRLKLPRFALERLRAIRGSRRAGRLCELDPNAVARRFRAFCRRHELPHVPMTCLRHSWATISLEHGASIEDIAVALGHTTVNTAMAHYLHYRLSHGLIDVRYDTVDDGIERRANLRIDV